MKLCSCSIQSWTSTVVGWTVRRLTLTISISFSCFIISRFCSIISRFIFFLLLHFNLQPSTMQVSSTLNLQPFQYPFCCSIVDHFQYPFCCPIFNHFDFLLIQNSQSALVDISLQDLILRFVFSEGKTRLQLRGALSSSVSSLVSSVPIKDFSILHITLSLVYSVIINLSTLCYNIGNVIFCVIDEHPVWRGEHRGDKGLDESLKSVDAGDCRTEEPTYEHCGNCKWKTTLQVSSNLISLPCWRQEKEVQM